ncbi:xanthine dehydrogenase family protein subunit M [Prescottella agglutinans]|uniref:Xanthine dehydrogenase family protein subunit M n=1 Tax=Prescottella agglutinans TaxID=1644129 RepID=A0A3S3BWX2_9NOCA|nr:xanthine dehydrogenase family protein subunit M [Prescottella agglutinans]RVW11134.1 xanthine dehydrogenase family protein subunit M [Prescottella agglutinans]
MQVPGLFEYERATDVENAIALLDRLGDEARVVAGGHSLLPMMKLRLANPEYLIDINDLVDELGHIDVDVNGADGVRIGAMVRHRQILESDDLAAVFPIFRDAEKVIADPVVRNRGTIGGSLCQADPAEDLTTVCSVVGAVCVIRGPTGVREVPMADFLVGPYETVVRGNEILIEVRIPRGQGGSSAYTKVERRVGDWAIAAAGAALWLDGDRIGGATVGLTAVEPDAEQVAAIGEFLRGRPATEETFRRAGELAGQACEPVTDPRGTAAYKRHLAAELTVRSLRTAADRAAATRTET